MRRMSGREAIAHAATPWEWKSRTRVIALVVVCVLLTAVAVAAAWLRGPGHAVFQGVIAAVLLIVPAVLSLHRWDRLHTPAR